MPASGDTKSTTTFNGAIALIEDPTEFLNTYLNSYRNYLKSLEPPAHFSNGHESDLLEESESSINIQDTSEVDEEENSLLQKLESVRSLWSSDADEGHLDDICLEGNIKNGFPPPLDVDIEGISEALDSLHLGGQQSPLASTPKIQNMNVKQRGDEKLIVHTTCLSSDGQSTETMIHETILKPPHEIPPVRNGKQEDNGERILRFVGHDIDISYPVGKVHPNADDNTGKTSEECDDDSDGTLTPGEEETNIKVPLEMETPREPILLLRRGQTNAEFESENKINAQRSRDMANYIR